MKKTLFMFFALAVLLTGCGKEQVAGDNVGPEPNIEPSYAGSVAIGAESYSLGDTVSYENVTVVPLISKNYDPQQEVDYITLAEATKNDWIEIIEKPGDETVSELTVRYSGPKPLLLLAGELLLGGKQDRVVAEDTVIDPISTVVVSVFCVESGRWSGSSNSFSFSGGQVPTSVKGRAMMGSQSEVWERTGDFNFLAGVPSDAPSTIGGGLRTKAVTVFTEKGRADLKSVLSGDEAIVGLVFIIDGRISSMEIFGAPRLLESSFDSIISGVLAEAAVSSGDPKDMPSQEQLLAFLESAFDAQTEALAASTQIGDYGTFYNTNVGASRRISGGFLRGNDTADGVVTVTHGSYINEED